MTGDARRWALRSMLDLRSRRPDVLDPLRRYRAAFAHAVGIQAGVIAVAARWLDAAWTAVLAGVATGGFFSVMVRTHCAAALWPLQDALTDRPAVERLALDAGLRAADVVE